MPDNAYGYIYPLGRPDAALYFDSYPAEYSDELKTHGGAEKVPGRAGDVIQVTGRGSPEFNFDVLFDEMNGPRTVPLAQWPGAHKAWEWLDYWLGDSAEDESDNDNLFVIRLVGGKPRDAWVQRVKRKREYEDDNGRVLRFSADFSGQWVRQTEVDASGFKRPRKARKPKPAAKAAAAENERHHRASEQGLCREGRLERRSRWCGCRWAGGWFVVCPNAQPCRQAPRARPRHQKGA